MAAFSERLRKLRESLNLSQNEFSKQLGVSRVSLTHYEAGDRTPDIDFLSRLHQYTGVSVYYLLGLTDSKDDTLATAQRDTGLCDEALVLLSNNTIIPDCINMMARHDILSKACAYIAILYNDHIRKKEIPETKWTNGMDTHRRESIDFLLSDLKVMIEQAAQTNSAAPIANIDENELPCNAAFSFVNRINQEIMELKLLREQGEWNQDLERKLRIYHHMLWDMTTKTPDQHLTWKITDTFCEFPEVINHNGEETPE